MTIPESRAARELRALFCERFGCPPSEFEKRALRKCLYLHARISAPLLRRLDPGWFERDLSFIQYFGNAKDRQEVTDAVAALHYREHLQPRFVRNTLRLRLSVRKADRLAVDLFQ